LTESVSKNLQKLHPALAAGSCLEPLGWLEGDEWSMSRAAQAGVVSLAVPQHCFCLLESCCSRDLVAQANFFCL